MVVMIFKKRCCKEPYQHKYGQLQQQQTADVTVIVLSDVA
jgi:hypothetical protein